MSYYSDASLVLIPSGYKDQKVYSAKPTDGSGDLVFSRASDATRVDSNGLIEKVRTNLLLQSNSFDTTWANFNTTDTGGQSGYDGSNDAWLLQNTAASGSIRQTITSSGVQTYSFYAKAGTTDWVAAYVAGSIIPYCFFDLTNGVKGATQNNVINSSITAVGGGWYRIAISFDNTTTDVRIFPAEANAVLASQVGDNIYIQNAQLEAGDIATDYIATTTAAVSVGPVSGLPRLDYSGGATCPKLLLEPQATALNQFSEQIDNAYWIKNDVTVEANTSDTLDPSGYYGADKIVETATTARHRVASGPLNLTAVNHTSSVFMKKGTARYGFVTISGAAVSSIVVDLEDGTITLSSTAGTIVAQKVESYGNGWYRISVTALGTAASGVTYSLQYGTAGSATPTFTSNVPSHAGSTSNYLYAWGANLTATSYLQSYIPTLSAAVTRGADGCSKTGISSLIGQTEGTIYLEADIQKYNESGFYISISNGAVLGSAIYLFQPSSGTLQLLVRNSGNPDAIISILSANWTAGFNKIAIAYTSTTAQVFINGTSKGTTSFIAVPTCSQFTIGSRPDATGNLVGSGPYSQALLFKTRLPNSSLEELTTL